MRHPAALRSIQGVLRSGKTHHTPFPKPALPPSAELMPRILGRPGEVWAFKLPVVFPWWSWIEFLWDLPAQPVPLTSMNSELEPTCWRKHSRKFSSVGRIWASCGEHRHGGMVEGKHDHGGGT